MASRLALFPLQSVVYPGERLPLHIFEERYKELINHCELTGEHFGIPVFMDKQMEYGTEMELLNVVNNYASGEKDIVCRGLRTFRITGFDPHEQGKLYAAGDVKFIEDDTNFKKEQKNELLELIKELYLHLEVPAPQIAYSKFNSYSLAHKIGLSLEQEYALLQLASEQKRQEFLINHLLVTIPIVAEMNRTKQTIELNGHFRNYDPLDFREFRLKSK